MTQPSPRVLLEVEDVCVDYRQGGPLWRRKPPFRAVEGVSFTLRSGEGIGVVGNNGAGKTTLLRVLAGLIQPTAGTVRRFTDSITLLALGAGYEGSIRARDNVVLNGMLLGIPRRRMQAKVSEIFRYAGLRDFQGMPIKNYSSGMRSRLAFANAVHVQTDVLLIDEVFTVGDQVFRAKSEQTMTEKIGAGQTFVLVSHGVQTIKKLCQRALWFEHGRLIADGSAEEVVDRYTAQRQV